MSKAPAVITFLTDFGLSDSYVGAMKGVMLGINPRAQLVDLCHEVLPQAVAEGAYLLRAAYRFFPQGTVHVAVVDPGVGTERRLIALDSGGYRFLAPDNGLLDLVVRDLARHGQLEAKRRHAWPGVWQIVGGARVVSLENRSASGGWLPAVSDTFHGRDILAPVAAHLSLGLDLEELGPLVNELTALAWPEPSRDADGSWVGHVLHVDRFGNLITDLEEAVIGRGVARVVVAGREILGLALHYQQEQELIAIFGSAGHLEISKPNGSAERALSVGVGETVRVWTEGG